MKCKAPCAGIALAAISLIDGAGAVFTFDLQGEAIVSATFSAEFAGLTAHRSIGGIVVNRLSLVGQGAEEDLSVAMFGSTDALTDFALIDQGPLGTGAVDVPVPPSFFGALEDGKAGLRATFTDTADGLFAIDVLSLTIETASGAVTAFIDANDGFGIGIGDGESLVAPLPESIGIGATGRGFDEAISSKSFRGVPEPGTGALAALALLAGALRRRRRRAAPIAREASVAAGTSVFLSVLILLAAAIAILPAGFDYPRNVPDNQKRYDGESIGVGEAFPQATLNKIKAHFPGVTTDEQARRKLRAFKFAIDKAIELVKKKDRRKGECLEMQRRNDRICVDFRNTQANGSVMMDKKSDCGNEPVNIGVNKLPCEPNFPVYDASFYQLFSTLLHESTHAVQDYLEPQNTENDEKAKVRFVIACNEIEAEQAENAVIDELDPALAQVEMGNPVPPNTPEPAKSIAQSIVDDANLNAQQKKDAAKALRMAIERIKRGNQLHIECREAQKDAINEYLSGLINFDMLQMKFRQTRWFAEFNLRQGDYGPLQDPVYTGRSDSPIVNQYDGEMDNPINTMLDKVDDIRLNSTGDRLYVVGQLGGNGVLLSYSDSDDNGFFEEDTRQLLIESPAITHPEGAPTLGYAAQNDTLLVFTNASNQLHFAADMVPDPGSLPDTLVFAGQIDPARNDIVGIDVSPDGGTIYGGIEALLSEQSALTEELDFAISLFNPSTSLYEPAGSVAMVSGSVYVPALLDQPVVGSTAAFINAPVETELEVWLLDANGVPSSLLTSGLTSTGRGEANLPYALPLEAGARIRVFDILSGMQSVIYQVAAGPDQLHVVGPVPNSLPEGSVGEIAVKVEFGFDGLANIPVRFDVLLGDVVFTAGNVSAGGATSVVETDTEGLAAMSFAANGQGPAVVRASAAHGALAAFSYFEVSEALPEPVSAQELLETEFGLSGGDALLLADPDADGQNNLAELALGSDPADPGDRGEIACELDANRRWIITIARWRDLTGIACEFEESVDLLTWNPAPVDVLEKGPRILKVRVDPVRERVFVRARISATGQSDAGSQDF